MSELSEPGDHPGDLRELLKRSAGAPRGAPSPGRAWRRGLQLRRRRRTLRVAVAGVAVLTVAVPAVGVPGAAWVADPWAGRDAAAVFLQGSLEGSPEGGLGNSPGSSPEGADPSGAIPATGPSRAPGTGGAPQPVELHLPAGLEPVGGDGAGDSSGDGPGSVSVQQYRDPADRSRSLSLTHAIPTEPADPAVLLEGLRDSYTLDEDEDPGDVAEREGGSDPELVFPEPPIEPVGVEPVEVDGQPGYLITLAASPVAQRVLVWVDRAGAAVHLHGRGDLDLLAIVGATPGTLAAQQLAGEGTGGQEPAAQPAPQPAPQGRPRRSTPHVDTRPEEARMAERAAAAAAGQDPAQDPGSYPGHPPEGASSSDPRLVGAPKRAMLAALASALPPDVAAVAPAADRVAQTAEGPGDVFFELPGGHVRIGIGTLPPDRQVPLTLMAPFPTAESYRVLEDGSELVYHEAGPDDAKQVILFKDGVEVNLLAENDVGGVGNGSPLTGEQLVDWATRLAASPEFAAAIALAPPA